MSSATFSADQRKTIAAMAGLFLLALALRMIGAGRESAWCDEIVCLQLLDIPNVVDYLREARKADPPMTPMYYLFAYGWAQVFGSSVWSLRMLSIVFSGATASVLFLIGQRMYGRIPGVLAGVLFAITPTHIYYGQEIRYYAFVGFWAALSMWAFRHIIEKSETRWWILHFLCNAILAWSHLFAVLLFPAQGIVMFMRYRRNWPIVLRWSALHALLMLSFIYWMAHIDYPLLSAYAAWIPPVTKSMVWSGIRAYCGSPYGLWSLPLPVPQGLRGAMIGAAALAVVALTMIGVLAAAWRVGGTKKGENSSAKSEDFLQRSCDAVLLIGWFLIPAVLLIVMAQFNNCYVPRYVLYCSLPAALLVGRLAANLRGAARAVLVSFLLAPYLFLAICYLVDAPIRADWKTAFSYILAQNEPETILCYRSPLWVSHKAIEYYGQRAGVRISRSMEDTALHNELLAAWRLKRPVWIVFGEDDAEPHRRFMKFAVEQKFQLSQKVFPTVGTAIYVYRTQPDSTR